MSHKPEFRTERNLANLARAAADVFSAVARDSVTLRGSFAVAISGGFTPRALHRTLAEEPFLFGIPWDRTHIFWVDEHCVPQNDPVSNYGAAREDFLNSIPIPIEQIHPMPGSVPPAYGAMKYQKELLDCLDPQRVSFRS